MLRSRPPPTPPRRRAVVGLTRRTLSSRGSSPSGRPWRTLAGSPALAQELRRRHHFGPLLDDRGRSGQLQQSSRSKPSPSTASSSTATRARWPRSRATSSDPAGTPMPRVFSRRSRTRRRRPRARRSSRNSKFLGSTAAAGDNPLGPLGPPAQPPARAVGVGGRGVGARPGIRTPASAP